ncbi:MAG: hypothetical protein EVA65_16575 [Oceanococcus sp.]|nr:MAG: hypothetical protein EVA65_16575 [Oceanococcus sp.]
MSAERLDIAAVIARNSQQLCDAANRNPRIWRSRLSPGQLAQLKHVVGQALLEQTHNKAPVQTSFFL